MNNPEFMKDYKELSRINFDKQAEIYDSTPTSSVSKFPKLCYPFILEEIRAKNPASLLDMGCGTGEILRLIRQDNKEISLSGIDLSPEMVKVAHSKEIEGAEIIIGDAENLPYPENAFDAVVCCQSFHHYPNPEKAFSSAYKILKSGGFFLICDMYIPSKIMRGISNHLMLSKMMDSGDVHIYGESELNKLFTETGFKDFKWARIHESMYMTSAVKP